MWLGVGGVLVDVPWDELGVVAWLSWLSCDCLRLSVVVVRVDSGFDSCYRVGL